MFSSFTFSSWLIVILLTTLFTLIYFFLFPIKNEEMQRRLESLNILAVGDEERHKKQQSFLQRVYILINNRMDVYMEDKIRKGKFVTLEEKFLRANVQVTVSQHWTQKILYTMLLVLLLSLLKNPIFIGIGAILGFILPDLSINEKMKKRQLQLKRELPDFLDLLAATAPAAKTLENAIKVVCDKTEGEIPSEFRRVLEEINAGRRTKDALKDMAHRCGFKEMDTLVAQINQAESLGSPVQETLEMQSNKMRKLKQQLAEIKARKASVTLILPTVFLLYVCIIIIAGPSVIAVMDSGAF